METVCNEQKGCVQIIKARHYHLHLSPTYEIVNRSLHLVSGTHSVQKYSVSNNQLYPVWKYSAEHCNILSKTLEQ